MGAILEGIGEGGISDELKHEKNLLDAMEVGTKFGAGRWRTRTECVERRDGKIRQYEAERFQAVIWRGVVV